MPGKGTFVWQNATEPLKDLFQDLVARSGPKGRTNLFEVRRVLEVEIAGLAAERAEPREIAELKRINKALEEMNRLPEPWPEQRLQPVQRSGIRLSPHAGEVHKKRSVCCSPFRAVGRVPRKLDVYSRPRRGSQRRSRVTLENFEGRASQRSPGGARGNKRQPESIFPGGARRVALMSRVFNVRRITVFRRRNERSSIVETLNRNYRLRLGSAFSRSGSQRHSRSSPCRMGLGPAQ